MLGTPPSSVFFHPGLASMPDQRLSTESPHSVRDHNRSEDSGTLFWKLCHILTKFPGNALLKHSSHSVVTRTVHSVVMH